MGSSGTVNEVDRAKRACACAGVGLAAKPFCLFCIKMELPVLCIVTKFAFSVDILVFFVIM